MNGEVVLSLPVSQSHHPCSSSAVTVPTAVDTVTPAGKRRGWSSESHCLPIRRRDEHSDAHETKHPAERLVPPPADWHAVQQLIRLWGQI